MSSDNRESGIALITVLCLLLLVSMLTASIVTVSQTASAQIRTFAEQEKSMILAEGVVARIYWLILNDKMLHTDRNLDKGQGEEDDETERFIADGTEHIIDFDGIKVTFSINDMMSGFDVSGYSPGNDFNVIETYLGIGKESTEELTTFKSRLLDYVDVDSLERLNGMENNDYKALGLYQLPRNSRMQYREEIMYIPGAREYFKVDDLGRLNSVKLILPAENAGGNYASRRFDGFSADKLMLMGKLKCTEDEALEILEAIALWKKEKIPLADSLDDDLLRRLKANFSFRESGFYNVIIKIAGQDNSQGRPLSISMQISPAISANGMTFYEWTFY